MPSESRVHVAVCACCERASGVWLSVLFAVLRACGTVLLLRTSEVPSSPLKSPQVLSTDVRAGECTSWSGWP
eukprot:1177429-Rhodomonas_salina.1